MNLILILFYGNELRQSDDSLGAPRSRRNQRKRNSPTKTEEVKRSETESKRRRGRSARPRSAVNIRVTTGQTQEN